ncbi:MAG: hypothetical protein U0989_19975 [Azonexus sp.]|nr:hypothetical protein [Azonexus sp.]
MPTITDGSFAQQSQSKFRQNQPFAAQPGWNHVAHMLHGLAGIDRKATKLAGKLRNKMQHGISLPSKTGFEKHSMFQKV